MIKCFIIFAGCFLFFTNTGCNESRNVKPPKTVRDTTIIASNAYSEIFLDSLLLEDFIDKEVKTDSIAHYMRKAEWR